jgi:outer membrane lipoprotein-sorting protein
MLLALTLAVSLILVGCGGGSSKPAGEPAKQESVADLFAKSKSFPGMTCDFSMGRKDTQPLTGKMAMAGKKMRVEMAVQNQKMVSIIDGDANVAYNYMPDQNTAMKVPIDPADTAKAPDEYIKAADPAKYKVLETTTYDGVPCKVLQIQHDDKSETKMWVRQDYGIPLRVEVTITDGIKTVIEYKNMKIGAPPADTFTLPQGVKVVDMGDMMKQIPKKQ